MITNKELVTKERQREILQAALSLLASEGTQALTIRNLAKALGVTEPAIYRHFDSKKDLLESLYGFVWKEMSLRLKLLLEVAQPAPQKLRLFLKSLWQYLLENQGVNLVLLSEAIHQNDPELKTAMWSLIKGVYELIWHILKEAQDNGFLKKDFDLALGTQIILGFMQIKATFYTLSDNPKESKADIESFVQAFFKGAKP